MEIIIKPDTKKISDFVADSLRKMMFDVTEENRVEFSTMLALVEMGVRDAFEYGVEHGETIKKMRG